jgi:hypothetical protein
LCTFGFGVDNVLVGDSHANLRVHAPFGAVDTWFIFCLAKCAVSIGVATSIFSFGRLWPELALVDFSSCFS